MEKQGNRNRRFGQKSVCLNIFIDIILFSLWLPESICGVYSCHMWERIQCDCQQNTLIWLLEKVKNRNKLCATQKQFSIHSEH
jgi:hypothetical protein